MSKVENIKTVEEAKEWSKKVFSKDTSSIVDEVEELLQDEDPNSVVVGEFKNKG